MKSNKKIIVMIAVVLALVFGLFLFPKTGSFLEPAMGNGNATENMSDVQVLQKWELPDVLREVSGIAYLTDDRFACVQDERGSIYIYNTATAKIEKEIPFADAGDYEGLAIAGENAYVVRSDGRLYEVQDFIDEKPTVKEFAGHLTTGHNIDGLCFDKNQNRLLLAIKGKEPQATDYKGIYAFNLASKAL